MVKASSQTLARGTVGVPSVESTINTWGNGLAVRLTKAIALTAGAMDGASVRISAEVGRIVIDVQPTKPTLDEMLARFNPAKHGGEAMAFPPVGNEILG